MNKVGVTFEVLSCSPLSWERRHKTRVSMSLETAVRYFVRPIIISAVSCHSQASYEATKAANEGDLFGVL